MQVEILKNVATTEANRYLRIATVSSKTAFCFLYIGNDEKSAEYLKINFKSGYFVEKFENAKRLFLSAEADRIDVIILDLPEDEKLRDFHAFLCNRNLHSIPIVYNYRSLSRLTSVPEFVDDVVELGNDELDLTNKISFLKRAKELNISLESFDTAVIKPSNYLIKQILDIVFATALILLLLPLFLVIIIAIKLESKGPIIYKAKRAGRGFRIFNFYKFRTMVTNADKKVQELVHLNQYNSKKNGAYFFKVSNDPRITKVGRFLRNTSLDELPQLFNVIKGDMSLVGNRPLPLYEAATLTTNEFVERFMAPAGITGLWQIKKRGRADMSAEERIRLDISYVKKSSLLYDLWIMLNTPKALIQKSDV